MVVFEGLYSAWKCVTNKFFENDPNGKNSMVTPRTCLYSTNTLCKPVTNDTKMNVFWQEVKLWNMVGSDLSSWVDEWNYPKDFMTKYN